MKRVKKSIRITGSNNEGVIRLMGELGINYSEAVNLILTNYFVNKNPDQQNVAQLFTTLADHLEELDAFKKL